MDDAVPTGRVAALGLDRFGALLLFGGSFDPPTRAHVELPERVRARLGFDAVLYVPAKVSPFKVETPPASAGHRVAMLRLALAGRGDRVVIVTDEVEAEDAAPSYTIDTVREVRAAMREGASLRLLLGGDQPASFERWREAEALFELADPVVMVRPPQSRGALLASLPIGSRPRWHGRVVEVEPMHASATAARRQLQRGGDTRDLLPESVARYSREHGLYA